MSSVNKSNSAWKISGQKNNPHSEAQTPPKPALKTLVPDISTSLASPRSRPLTSLPPFIQDYNDASSEDLSDSAREIPMTAPRPADEISEASNLIESQPSARKKRGVAPLVRQNALRTFAKEPSWKPIKPNQAASTFNEHQKIGKNPVKELLDFSTANRLLAASHDPAVDPQERLSPREAGKAAFLEKPEIPEESNESENPVSPNEFDADKALEDLDDLMHTANLLHRDLNPDGKPQIASKPHFVNKKPPALTSGELSDKVATLILNSGDEKTRKIRALNILYCAAGGATNFYSPNKYAETGQCAEILTDLPLDKRWDYLTKLLKELTPYLPESVAKSIGSSLTTLYSDTVVSPNNTFALSDLQALQRMLKGVLDSENQ